MRSPFKTRVYILLDPRDGQRAYVGLATAPEALGKPCVHPRSPAAGWLAELAGLKLEPLVSFEGLPMTAVSEEAAKWLAAKVKADLVAGGVTVLTGLGPSRHTPKQQPPGRVRADYRPLGFMLTTVPRQKGTNGPMTPNAHSHTGIDISNFDSA